MIERDNKFNCEHVVPQSWFDYAYPMKSDLHHLFTCDPVCNSSRSNYPYYDFIDYQPEHNLEKIRRNCGKYEDNKFEPESDKGTVARATLYFLLRYPKIINQINQENLDLLLKWNQKLDVTLHEKHRNKAIFEAQGNRNPLIDFPEKAKNIDFSLSLS